MKIKKTLASILLAATLSCTNSSTPRTSLNVLNNDTYQENTQELGYNIGKEDISSQDIYSSSRDIQSDDISTVDTNSDSQVGYDSSAEEIETSDVAVEEITEVEITQDEIIINDNYQCSDFSKFPGYFYEGGIFNGYFVIGENASTIDTLAAIDISNSMPGGIVDSTKWDSEIAYVSTQNLISIGNPCNNSVTAELLGNSTDCVQGFYPGEGKIISLQHKDTGNLALIVAGYSGTDTRLAGRVIAHRLEELKEMGGCVITVEGSTPNDAEINNKK